MLTLSNPVRTVPAPRSSGFRLDATNLPVRLPDAARCAIESGRNLPAVPVLSEITVIGSSCNPENPAATAYTSVISHSTVDHGDGTCTSTFRTPGLPLHGMDLMLTLFDGTLVPWAVYPDESSLRTVPEFADHCRPVSRMPTALIRGVVGVTGRRQRTAGGETRPVEVFVLDAGAIVLR